MKASIVVTLKNPVEQGATDLGALIIKHPSGRGYVLDVDRSWLADDGKRLELRATEDRETFPEGESDEYRYDLTLEDIQSGELTATLFVSTEAGVENEVTGITYELEDEDGNTISDELVAVEEE